MQNVDDDLINVDDDSDDEYITIDQVFDTFNETLYSDFSASDFTLLLEGKEIPPRERASTPISSSPWTHVNRKRPRVHQNTHNSSSKNHTRARKNSVVYGSGIVAGVRSATQYHDKSPYARRSLDKNFTGVRSTIDNNLPRHRRFSGNKNVTGVFATRLHPSTTIRQIKMLIKSATGRDCSPETLRTRHEGYSSFYIHANHVMRTDILDSSIWPHGTLIKPFRC